MCYSQLTQFPITDSGNYASCILSSQEYISYRMRYIYHFLIGNNPRPMYIQL